MNIVLLRPSDWIDHETVCLRDHRAQHLLNILKVAADDSVRVGVINGERGVGIVAATSEGSVTLVVTLGSPPLPRHPFDLVVALPRPKMLRRILRTVAEFGVNQLHFINSYRVEKSFWQSPHLNTDKIEDCLIAGLERSGDTQMPEVFLHHRFRPFVEDELPLLLSDKRGLIAHPGDHQPLAADKRQPSVLMLGPEGGFIPFELELAQENGMQPCQLGSRILSVDTAVNAVLARELH